MQLRASETFGLQFFLPMEYVFLSIENSNLHERTNPIKNNSIDPQETHVATHNQPLTSFQETIFLIVHYQ